MGSKKLKRKKLKHRGLMKFYKLKADKPKKNNLFENHRENDGAKNLLERNIPDNGLSSKKCSRSYIGEENISDLTYFAEIREDYFHRLQKVVCNNCELFDSTVTEEILENLALALEQNALLACLQVEVYKKSMLNIIKAINKRTKEKQVHEDVKRLLSDSIQRKSHQSDTPKSTANSLEIGTYSRIPTVEFTRTNKNFTSNNFWEEEELMYNLEPYSMTDHCAETYSENQNDPQINSSLQLGGEEKFSLMLSQTNNWSYESPQTSKYDFRTSQNVITCPSPVLQNNFNNLYVENSALSYNSSQSEEQSNEVDPLSLSRNQLQKLVEQTLNDAEKVNKQKQDEKERACIAQILEGDNSLDERFNDSLSDNENESKENIDESNLMNRLEKMREIFGVEDEENQAEIIQKKTKQSYKVNNGNIQSRRPIIWRYEKFIQLHKYFIIASEVNNERRQINEELFIELFGEDSDAEHEVEFSSTEKYRTSCTERISSWVVKYLMPFYHNKRILGRNVFKSLGHYISETIVDEIEYPDEWAVKYYVSKFFPPKKKYVCDADILNFQLD